MPTKYGVWARDLSSGAGEFGYALDAITWHPDPRETQANVESASQFLEGIGEVLHIRLADESGMGQMNLSPGASKHLRL